MNSNSFERRVTLHQFLLAVARETDGQLRVSAVFLAAKNRADPVFRMPDFAAEFPPGGLLPGSSPAESHLAAGRAPAFAQELLRAGDRVYGIFPSRASFYCEDIAAQGFQQFARHFIQEARAPAPLERVPAVRASLPRPGKDQPIARPRHAHVTESPLLFEACLIVKGKLVRKQTFFHPHQKHDVEFQPLGAVQSHQRDARAFVVIIGVGDQRRVVQELCQRDATLFRFYGGVHQFLKILDAVLRFRQILQLQDFDSSGCGPECS